jgi:CYTH domain-containing protein
VRNGTGTTYYRTVKLGEGVRRIEVEEPTTEAVFDALWPLTEGCRVRKRRYRVTEGALCWEIDEFTDRPLFLAEIELHSEHERPDFPAWLAPFVTREVTDDRQYVNLNLAR